MPTYLYKTQDGEVVEHFCSFVNRPESITLDDARVAYYDFLATAETVRTQLPSLDGEGIDRIGDSVHPNQVEEYNRTAAAIGIGTRWNERGYCVTPDRAERKKLENAKRAAVKRGGDPEFNPPKNGKGIRV